MKKGLQAQGGLSLQTQQPKITAQDGLNMKVPTKSSS